MSTDLLAPNRGIVTCSDLAKFMGRSHMSAWRLLKRLEANGLKRKGTGSGTFYDKAEFLKYYDRLDMRN